MAVTAFWYGKCFLGSFGANPINFTSDTIKVALATSSYSPNQDTDQFFSDVTNEVVGTGYTAGGATLGSATLTYSGGSNTATFSGANTSWASSTITARYAVVYKSTGTAGTSPLMIYVNFGADVSTTAGTFQITWSGSGICTVTVA